MTEKAVKDISFGSASNVVITYTDGSKETQYMPCFEAIEALLKRVIALEKKNA